MPTGIGWTARPATRPAPPNPDPPAPLAAAPTAGGPRPEKYTARVPTAVFVAPFLLDATLRFIEAAASTPGVRLAVISQDPEDRIPVAVRARLAAHWRIDDGTDAQQIADATRALAAQLGGVDRLVGMLEQLQVPLGEVRDTLRIPGMGAEVARNFRDKSRMKDVFTAHGVPCARHGVATSADQARGIAAQLGLPVVVKPPAGAGARSTFRIDTPGQLADWLSVDAPSDQAPALLEELVQGDEHSFDSVSVDGRVVWHSISSYLPTPLEVLENPWIQWAVLLPRSIDGPEYDAIRDGAQRGLRALGMVTGFSHMEWFRLQGGRIALSEVAARPPGAQFTSLLSYAHEMDMYAAWARLEILGEFDPPQRHHAVGAVYLRGQGRGVVRGVHGLEVLQRELGDLVVEARLPRDGQPRSESYEGEGYVILRGDDTAMVQSALRRIVEVARVELAEV
jgi:phosphoribosylaminoimidazole carboxylase (NCAIR synthetase)